MNLNEFQLFENVETENITYQTKHYSKNQTLHNQGEVCDAIDLVLSGTLVAYSLSEKGNENIVFQFAQGNVVGGNLLFGNQNHYPLNIYCTSDCEILCLSKDTVAGLLKDPVFSMNFIKNISLNSQGMNKKIAMYTQKTLRENIYDYLTALSVQQKTNKVQLPITKKELADYFGVERPSLFRELKKMKEEGIVEISNRCIYLHKEKTV